jgi:glutamine transport system substrate-binding protein
MRLRTLFAFMLVYLLLIGSVQAKPLTVAIDPNFSPFAFKTKYGLYTGFDVDLWDAIAKKINKPYQFVPMGFKDIIPGLQTNQFDVAIAGITIKKERMKTFDFSDGYYNAGLLILVRGEENSINRAEDLHNKVVATKFATHSADFTNKWAKTKNIKLFPNTDAMVLELLSGGADAVIFDSPIIAYLMRQSPRDLVKIVGPLYMGKPYGIAFPKGSPLVSEVNAALKKLRADGSYAELYRKWFRTDPK